MTDTNPSHYLGFLLNLGNQVWFDADNDGLIDSNEAGVAGVAVELYKDTDADGVFTPGVDQYVATTNTLAGGYYTFTSLVPGDYVVVITGTNFAAGGVLADYRSSTDIATSGDPDNNIDSDDNGLENATGTTVNYVASSAVSLSANVEPDTNTVSGDSNWSVDFGFYKLVLGNQVWEDLDLDGMKDASEPTMSGVVVNLVEAGSGNVISTTTTDANGLYTFTGMSEGSYQVVIVPPTGYEATIVPNSGQAIIADSDNDGVSSNNNIASAVFYLNAGVDISWCADHDCSNCNNRQPKCGLRFGTPD
ncbi:MAG: SdrD B-like domain-containing protein [Candidatus Nanopelagicales bacterium]